MADKLTPQQEAFAFSVGFEHKSYSEAYREHYKVKPGTTDRATWVNASKLANSTKVSLRIDEFRKKRQKEFQRSFSWSIEEAEKELRFVLNKNKNDLKRAELNKQPAKQANNNAMLGAIQQLNDIHREAMIQDKENEVSNANITIVDQWGDDDE